MTFHIEETESHDAAEKLDENQRSGQPQPASPGPESAPPKPIHDQRHRSEPP